jgi:hypothetical protein
MEFGGQDRFFRLLINKKYFTSILTPSTAFSRFLSVFSKNDLKSKKNRSEKIRLNEGSSKVPTFVRKSFYPKILK